MSAPPPRGPVQDVPVPHSIDVATPDPVRMWDWFLGGTDNYPSDRYACRILEQIAPGTRTLVRANAAFRQRVVDVLARTHGVRQFLDLGCGLPTTTTTYRTARRTHRAARVVYIDNDPIAVAHGRAVLDENDQTRFVEADPTDVDSVLEHPDVTGLIDRGAPLAALFTGGLHRFPGTPEPGTLLRRAADALPPGSLVAFSQIVSDSEPLRQTVTDFMLEATSGTWGRVRSHDEVKAWVSGMRLLNPGLTEVGAWRPASGTPPAPGTPTGWQEWGAVGAWATTA